ncbi:MAG: AAA family ATPase, partial [Oceanihabitans sp.]
MLTALSIKNYALIDNLQVNFNSGFTIITGETGAGKSILLGGLSLILGKRADLKSLKNKEKKCVIEAVFDITNYALENLFQVYDLDFEPQTIIRREILPSGKSRAFINDTPVNLNSLQALGEKLIDVHSQQETLQLAENNFQFQVVDALANNSKHLQNYQTQLNSYKQLQKEKQDLLTLQAQAIKEQDYSVFLLTELQQANIVDGELEQLEEEYETLNNIEVIQEKLEHAHQLLQNEDLGIISLLTQLKNNLQQLTSYAKNYQELFARVQSNLIDLDDTLTEIEAQQESLDANPNRLEVVNTKLQTLHNLMQKHVAKDTAELLTIKNQLEQKVAATQNLDSDIEQKEAAIKLVTSKLQEIANTLHKNRIKTIPKLQ